jgi:hypothetical protein
LQALLLPLLLPLPLPLLLPLLPLLLRPAATSPLGCRLCCLLIPLLFLLTWLLLLPAAALTARCWLINALLQQQRLLLLLLPPPLAGSAGLMGHSRASGGALMPLGTGRALPALARSCCTWLLRCWRLCCFLWRGSC